MPMKTKMVPKCKKCGGAVKWDKEKGWVHRKTGTYKCPDSIGGKK